MKKNNPKTPALVIFKDKNILNERPEGMPYEDYKIIRKQQSEVIKRLFKKSK